MPWLSQGLEWISLSAESVMYPRIIIETGHIDMISLPVSLLKIISDTYRRELVISADMERYDTVSVKISQNLGD